MIPSKKLSLLVVLLWLTIHTSFAATKPDILEVSINGTSIASSTTVNMEVGSSFRIYIEVENNGDDSPAYANHIAISFPSFLSASNKNNVTLVQKSSDLSYTEYWGSEGPRGDRYAEFVMVEAVDQDGWDGSDWFSAENNDLTLDITPLSSDFARGYIDIYVRVAASNVSNSSSNWTYNPSSNIYKDSLGYPSYRVRVTLQPPPKPDLVVKDILINSLTTLPTVTAGDSVRLDFMVKNQGNAGTNPGVSLKWWYGTTQNAKTHEIATGSLGTFNGLSAGEEERETELSWQIPDLVSGTYWITAEIDWNHQVDEGDNENNNILSESFVVIGKNHAPSRPVRLWFDELTNDGATIAWDPCTDPDNDSIVYELQYNKRWAIDPWESVNPQTTSSTRISLHGFDSDQSYNVRVRSRDAQGATSEWTAQNGLFKTRKGMTPTLEKNDFEYSSTGASTTKSTPLGERIPIILVHGNNGDQKAASLNYWYWWVNDNYLNSDLYAGKFKVYRYVYDTSQPISDNGDDFAAFVTNYSELSGHRVLIIAHSMGGLVTRYALNTNAELREKTIRLITLGTPHLGSPLANPTWIYSSEGTLWENLLEYAYELSFSGTKGDLNLAWYDPTEIPSNASTADTTVKNAFSFNWERYQLAMTTPFTGSDAMVGTTADSLITAFGGYLNDAKVTGLLESVTDFQVKSDVYTLGFASDHFGLYAGGKPTLARARKSNGTLSFKQNDGVVPIESSTLSGHNTVLVKNLTQIIDEPLDHSSFLDGPILMDQIMAYILGLAPELAPIGNRSVIEGETLEFGISGINFAEGTPTFTASNLPQGATFVPSTKRFRWTPGYDTAGTHQVTFSIHSSSIPSVEDKETITITVVNKNRAPVLATIGDKRASVYETIDFTPSASDPDSETLTFSLSGRPSGAAFNNQTGRFLWTPGSSDVGNYTMTFTVTDSSSPALSDSETILLTVGAINRPPVIQTLEDKTIEADQLLQFSVFAADPDLDAISWSAENLPNGATFNATAAQFQWRPTTTDLGTHTITLTATDNGTPPLSRSISPKITVTSTNDPPMLGAIGDKSIYEGNQLTFTLSATDPNGDSLKFSADPLPTDATFDTTTGRFAWIPGYEASGSYPIQFKVTDNHALPQSDTESITITVHNQNRRPQLATIGNQAAKVDQTLKLIITAIDADKDNLAFSTGALPGGASFDANSQTFEWTPSVDQVGTHQVLFYATDDGTPSLKDTESIEIVVGSSGIDGVTAPTLIFPGQAEENIDLNVDFKILATANSNLRYFLYLCTNPNFQGCDSSEIRVTNQSQFAGLGWSGVVGLSLSLGLLLAFGVSLKRFKNQYFILLSCFLILVACGGGGSGASGANDSSNSGTTDQTGATSTPTSIQPIIHTVTGLTSSTIYYWKVVVADPLGNIVETGVRQFSTR